jgi:putative dimethyl sulfoxide reductase chaperone
MLTSSDTKIDEGTEIVHRANIYKLLADCFRYPQGALDETLDGIKSEIMYYEGSLIPSVEKLIKNYDGYTLQEIQVEFSKLFIGPYQLEAPPYSSVYLDNEGLVMGEATQHAIRFYVEAGLDPSKENHDAPDHISIELEFMYFLLFQGIVNENEKFIEQSKQFINEHLALWVFSFIKKIVASTENSFYLELAKLLEKFISIERSLIQG